MLNYVEAAASWLFANAKGRDAKAFTKGPAFTSHPVPTIPITSPDCGADGATLSPEYMFGGQGKIPELKWETVEGVRQWLLVSEDPDAPLPTPICHGIYLGIDKDKLSVTNDDFKQQDASSTKLAGGFYYGTNRRNNIYIPPRPLLNHGIHRYFFDIVALNEPLDATFVASKPTRDRVAKEIDGKVIAWGRWTGQCERRWK
ncbi:phosphatidylethanolamine-binding protein [Trichoderma novae-zelandiae]